MPSSARLQAIHSSVNRPATAVLPLEPLQDLWACDVFGLEAMRSALPKEVFRSIQRSIREGGKLDLSVADVVLQEHDLTLVRSAVTLTVSGELEEPDPDDLEDEFEEDLEDADEESDLYELLIQFRADDREYGLYIPLDPFFVVARMEGGHAVVVEGEEFERIQPRMEAELDERERES